MNSESKNEKVKSVTIIVNATPFTVEKDEISYDHVVTLTFPDFPQHPERTYSVTYTKGQGHKPEGILSPGAVVKVKEGMNFKIKHTGQS
ncbi:MAG: multiubiquitin domain-containing protein [Bacteroidota bacterium]|nr:multiubiquitin domain-containing protein [Bacteroidota bacterium]